MSAVEKLIWKPDTPGSEPAGARISAGKSGQRADVVAEDGGRPGELGPGELHAVAGIAGEADRDPLEVLDVRLGFARSWSSRALRLLHPLMRSRRQVQQLLRERLGEVLEDVLLADHADQAAGIVDERARCGSARRRTGRSRRGRSARGGGFAARFIRVSTGASRSTWPPTIAPKMSRSVRTPRSRPSGSATTTESPVPDSSTSRRHSPSEVPSGTVNGSRRLTTRSVSRASEGTRSETARSESSATLAV